MKLKFRTVFISDVHLGSNGSQAKEVAKFLKCVSCDRLYLVGDIIDMWRLKQRWYWPAEHNEVVRRVLKMIKKGTEVVFVPGNHDEAARQYHGLEFGGVKVEPHVVHESADGRKYLVIHGDQFDLVVKHSRVLSVLGSVAYEWLLRINAWYNKCRLLLGYKYWSLSAFLKLKVKHACTFISRFEETLMNEAKRRGMDGVICGHIHHSERIEEDGVEYLNCGDWVESCTAIVEYQDGRMEIVNGLDLVREWEIEKDLRKQELEAGEFAGSVADENEEDEEGDDMLMPMGGRWRYLLKK
ncbi:UDP-2,3-diacylglucosamine diphosphatase [Planctomycetota bacterium]|nr:UDP-2,3-diacylglucosamine diphosphatase [Planctomycetota bacterium]